MRFRDAAPIAAMLHSFHINCLFVDRQMELLKTCLEKRGMELPSSEILSDILVTYGRVMVADPRNMPDDKYIEVFSGEKRMILYSKRNRCKVTCM